MAYTLEVKYFNSFWLKKVVGSSATGTATIGVPSTGSHDRDQPTWPGLPWQPIVTNSTATPSLMRYPYFPWGDPGLSPPSATPTYHGCPVNASGTGSTGEWLPWYVEEARITGGYNNTNVSYGVRAYMTTEEDLQQHRFNSLIYSGVFNSRTGINDTNVFSVGEAITKSSDPINGSIQRLYTEDTNLTVFQEFKVSRALIDKDTIYTAESGTQTQAAKEVIGQIVPYTGEFGISKNPESLGVYGYRKYFSDRNNTAILRLSNDGITEISAYGMTDYFRDYLATITDDWQEIPTEFTIADLTPYDEKDYFRVNIPFNRGVCQCCQIRAGMGIVLSDGVSETDSGLVVAYVNAVGASCDVYLDLSNVDIPSVNGGLVINGSGLTGPWLAGDANIVPASDALWTPGSYPGVIGAGGFSTSGGGSGAITVTIALGTPDTVESIVVTTPGSGWAINDTITINGPAVFGGGANIVLTLVSPHVTAITYTSGKFVEYVQSKVVGGWNIHHKNYSISMQPQGKLTCIPAAGPVYNTLGFDEQTNGWVSFYSYQPMAVDSLRNKFYSFTGNEIYEHYDQTTANSRGTFYGTQSDSSITFVFNPDISITKNFLTISYEGSNGWEVDSFSSDIEEPNQSIPITIPPAGTWQDYQDSVGYVLPVGSRSGIYSYEAGAYVENGVTYRAGFDRKENRYVANLVNDSTFRAGEVISGSSVSGIKGYFATVKISTDNATDVGGMKELYAVSSTFVKSSY